MASPFFISPFNALQTYKQYDIVYGIDLGSSVAQSPYYYATQDQTSPYHPSGVYSYSITGYSRQDDVVTVMYTHTGGAPFAAGSQATIVGVTQKPDIHFTGMVRNGSVVGTVGMIQYVAPGYNAAMVGLAAGTINCFSPAWTTGYFFIPAYTTKLPYQNSTINTQLGNGYVQVMSNGLNTFTQNPSLVYLNIDSRQAKAITNYVLDKAGVTPFPILLNDTMLSNQPNLKYWAKTLDEEPVSYGRVNMTVGMERAFLP